MIKLNRLFYAVLTVAMLFFAFNLNAQVLVGTTPYSTIKAAFDAINAGTFTGDITITINGNTSETAAAVLMASGNGSANYTSVVLYPTGTSSITGSVAYGLIELRGADNVTIDGRINRSGTTNSLTIQNSYTAAAACSIWLDSLVSGVGGGATSNIIRNCNILGGSNSSSNCRCIDISSSSSLTTAAYGNSNNQILYNTFSKAYYGVYAYSVTGYPNWQNGNLQIKYNTFGTSTDPLYYSMYVYACRNTQITDNLIQYQNLAGGYGLYLYYSYNGTFSNNTYSNITNTSTYYAMYFYYDTSATVSGNSLSNITTTSTFYGCYLYYSPYLTFSNNNINGISSASSIYPLYLQYAQNSTISGNTINNINCTSSGSFYGLYLYYGDNSTVSTNTISNVNMALTTYGLYNTSSASVTYTRNKIYNMKSFSLSGYGCDGIYLGAGNNALVTNNVIYNLTTTNYSASSTIYNPFGININAGTGHRIYFNSVYLYGTQAANATYNAGTLSAAMMVSGSAVSSIDVRDNVFVNSLIGLTGSQSYAIYLYATGNLTGSTINYNDYYPSGTYGVLGYLTSNRTTMTDWRSATGQDANSFSSNPAYNSTTNLRPQNSSPLLAAGTPLAAVTVDYLNVNRSLTTPTIGGYEQSGDFAGPDISFTALVNVTSTTNRQVDNITITDASGINTSSGTKPRIYYKKSTNSNVYNDNTSATDGWKWVETTSSSSPFSFTVDYSKINGTVTPGTQIDYFFVAQDLSSNNNVGTSLLGFNTSPTSVALTSSAFPVSGQNNYQISAVLSGNYTVGATGTFSSLTNSGGLFQVMGGGQLSGDVTIQITSDLTSETGTYALNQWTEQGVGGYTVKIVPDAAVNRTISGSIANGLIKLNGASRVTIDGSYGGSGNYLTISNTNTSANATGVHIASINTTGITNVSIKNCNISSGSTTAANYGIYVGGSSIGAAGDNCDNVTISNNNISRCYNGIYVLGTSTNVDDNLIISGNNIGSYTSGYLIGFKAVHLSYVNNSTCTKNTIFNITQTTNCDAIYITTGVTNSTFTKNIFKDLYNTSGYRINGIYVGSGTTSNLTFANNLMYSIIGDGTGGISWIETGFYIAAGSGYNIYHNSVVLTGNRDIGSYATSSPSACLYIASGLTGINVRNNLFYNTQVSPTNPSSAQNYCVYDAGTNAVFGTINNNDYYFSGSTAYIGYLTSTLSTLSAWQSATAQDGNSISSDPSLNDVTVPVPLPNSPLLSAGSSGTGITDDMVGYTRSTTAPTIGAYEQGADVSGPIMSYTPTGNSASTSNKVLSNFATITDYSGVNTTTNPPRLYYRKTTNNNTYVGNTSADNGWKYVTGTNSGSSFSFTIDYSKLTGGSVSVNDVIEYFVIAQDNTSNNNTSYKYGSLTTIPTSVVLTSANFPMTSASSYTIVPAIGGTINVGTGQTFTSLTRSDGLFQYINKGALTSNLTVNITSSLLLEDGTTALNEIPSEGGLYNIVIQPANANNYTISGSYSGGLIRLNGTDRITFDGSYGGSGKYLTFTNTLTSGTIATFQLISNTYGAKFVTIKNCNISTGFNAGTSIGINVGDAVSTAPTAADCDNLTIQNNIFTTAYVAMSIGGTGTGMLDNLLIENNIIGSNTSANYVTYRGIYLQNAENPMIRNNTIFNLITSTLTNQAGIEIGGTFNNGYITRNRIYSVKNNNTGWWGAYGINVLAGSGVQIDNNFIYDITTIDYSGTSNTYNPFGIRLAGGSNLKLYHNTVNMFGTQATGNGGATFSAALLINLSTITGLDIRNNIFRNALAGQTGSKSYCMFIYSTTPSTVFSQCNYNDYYPSGSYGVLGGYGTGTNTDITSISSLQTATTKDQNSITLQPNFISDSDPHISGTSVGDNRLYCPLITGITVDFDGETRRTTNLYIGADEVRPILGFINNMTFNPNLPVYCDNESNIIMSFTPTVTGFGDGITRTITPTFGVKWYKNGGEILGNTNYSNIIYPIFLTDAGNYNAQITYAGESTYSSSKNLYVEKRMAVTSLPSNANVCSTDPTLVLNVGTTGTVNAYQWQKENPSTPGIFNNILGQTTSQLTIALSDAKQATGTYRLQIYGPGNCGPANITSDTLVVNVTEPITNTSTVGDVDVANICFSTPFTLTANASGTILGYQWQKWVNGNFTNLLLADYPTANTRSLYFKSAKVGESGKYRCLITGSPKCHASPVPTPEINVTVWPLFEIAKDPVGKLMCKGDSTALIVFAEGTIYKYQWQKDGVDLDPLKFLGANGPMLVLMNMQYINSGAYTCVLTIQDCAGMKNVTSKPALCYVVSETKITYAQVAQPVQPGGTAFFEARAHAIGAPIDYQPDVQWYRGETPLKDNDRIAGSKSSIMTIRDIQPADYGNDYKVIVTGICSVDSAMNVAISAPPMLNVKTQPVDISECEGGTITLTVETEVTPSTSVLTYQWKRNGIDMDEDADCKGVRTASLTLSNLGKYDGDKYWVVVTAQPGNIVVCSGTAVLTVKLKPYITKQSVAKTIVKTDDPIDLFVDALGEAPLTYQWNFNGTPITGETNPTLHIDKASSANEGVYTCDIINACGTVASRDMTIMVTVKNYLNVNEVNSEGWGLSQSNPNPVNGKASIGYAVPKTTHVTISVFDASGKEVTVLLDKTIEKGFNEVEFDASALNLTSGTYYYTMKADGFTDTKKLVLVR